MSWLAGSAAALLVVGPMILASGCGKKDAYTEAAPPPAAGARPDPAPPAGGKQLPGAVAPGGGAPAAAPAAAAGAEAEAR